MNYELTEHAKKVMQERNIQMAHLEETILDPDVKMKDENDPELEHRLKVIKENENRVLRVILNIVTFPMKVVTMFFDRRMKDRL